MPDLDPETISLALVGRFLKGVCDLEETLNEAIAGVLNIDDTKRFILCANIHFREKIQILRSFVHNSSLTDSDRDKLNLELLDMGNLYDHRNVLAHQYFKTAPNGDGIIFSIVPKVPKTKTGKKGKKVGERRSKRRGQKHGLMIKILH